jgi:hypothetical protein
MDNIPDVAELAPKIYEVVKQVPYGQVTTNGDGCNARIKPLLSRHRRDAGKQRLDARDKLCRQRLRLNIRDVLPQMIG